VDNGLVTNLARPEGNVTGVAWLGVLAKQMEVLKEIVPHLKRFALVSSAYLDSTTAQGTDAQMAIFARRLGFTWQRFRATNANDFAEIFARIDAEHFDAAAILPDPLILQNATRLIELALRYRIPTSAAPEWAKGGLLLGYGQDSSWSAGRTADYIDKILRGAKPSDLPVEQAARLELVINLKAAKALGLTVPPAVFVRADEVIE
jgi:putative tryptophan/tyrosine transport system substrate-binding protein